jgi:four helix bundle protein
MVGPKGPMLEKSFKFAVRIVGLSRFLSKNGERVISRQVLRSGTAIGAMMREAQFAESHADFIHKQCIALKEANETCYWLDLLHHTQSITKNLYESIFTDADELLKMLVASTKTLKSKKTKA